MGTTLLILCLPLNHKHNTDPPKLPAQCQTDSFNLLPPKLPARCQTDSFNPLPPKPHPPNTVSDTRTQSPT